VLPAYVLRPLLRYFDGVDEIVSAGLVTAKPHFETSLTSDLCTLMDTDEQSRYALRHKIGWLQGQLAERLPGVDIEFNIDTIEYPSIVENLVTQSDLGLVVEFVDHIAPDRSWQAAALFQAKRLTVSPKTGTYTGDSKYGAPDADQRKRIQVLHKVLGYDIVNYLLYTPRPEALDPTLASELRYRRDLNLAQYIFDYSDGLAIHRELTRKRRFVDGGIVVSPVSPKPVTLRNTYDRILHDNLTWAWYLSLLLLEPGPSDSPGDHLPKRYSAGSELPKVSPILLASGDPGTAADIAGLLRNRQEEQFPFLPARSIWIRVTAGVDPEQLDITDEERGYRRRR
jgi:hypothetical protein